MISYVPLGQNSSGVPEFPSVVETELARPDPDHAPQRNHNGDYVRDNKLSIPMLVKGFGTPGKAHHFLSPNLEPLLDVPEAERTSSETIDQLQVL